MTLRDVYTINREGVLISNECLRDIDGSCQSVKQINNLTYEAKDAAAASCWLLKFILKEYTLNETTTDTKLLGFRGQKVKYDRLVPSASRLEINKRNKEYTAVLWFCHLLNELYMNHYEYSSNDVHKVLPFCNQDLQMVAQHYGMATNFLDWSWDPLIAVMFSLCNAEAGEYTQVLIRKRTPDSVMDFMLPPTCCKRVWEQKGYFQPIYGDYSSDSVSTSSFNYLKSLISRNFHVDYYMKIRFPARTEDIDYASEIIQKMLTRNDPLLPLTELAYGISEVVDSNFYLPSFYTEFYELPLEKLRSNYPEIENYSPVNDIFYKEDLHVIEEYLKSIFVRRIGEKNVINTPLVIAMRHKMKNSFTDSTDISLVDKVNGSSFIRTIYPYLNKIFGTNSAHARMNPFLEY